MSAAPSPAPSPPRRRLLLHACCGPCSTHCVRALREAGVEPVVLFSNSNLDSEAEFEKRLAALRAFAAAEGVRVEVDPYDPASWERATAGQESEPEGGARCDACFRHNLGRAARKAAELGLPFSTTLTVRPHKSSPKVFAAGRAAAAAAGAPSANAPAGTPGAFEPWDFKKKDGFLDSVRLARAYGLYRQDYCGCRFSKSAAEARRRRSAAGTPASADSSDG